MWSSWTDGDSRGLEHFCRRRRGRNGLAVLAERVDVEANRLADVLANLVHRVAAGSAAGKVGDVCRVATVVGLFDDVEVFHRVTPCSPAPHRSPACLSIA